MTAGTDRPASDHHKKFRGQEMGADPRSILRNGKMIAFQIIVVIYALLSQPWMVSILSSSLIPHHPSLKSGS